MLLGKLENTGFFLLKLLLERGGWVSGEEIVSMLWMAQHVCFMVFYSPVVPVGELHKCTDTGPHCHEVVLSGN